MTKKYLVMDVDGTLTDGKIYMGNNGEIMKAFNIKDGCGINLLLPRFGMIPVIITSRKSKIIKNRCKEIGIDHLYQGIDDKSQKLKDFLQCRGDDFSEVAYAGDDLNDLPCMALVKEKGGLVGAPLNACKEVKDIADFVASVPGGEGAVREFIEWIIRNYK